MTRYFLYASILVASAALGVGFTRAGHVSATISVALLGVLWIVAHVRGLSRVNGLAFALFVFISVVSIWADVSPWLALACITFSLIAWDLSFFLQRLKMVHDQGDCQAMERVHFARLALVIGLGLVGYVSTTRLRINLTFGGAVLLALLGIWGISALVYRLRSHE